MFVSFLLSVLCSMQQGNKYNMNYKKYKEEKIILHNFQLNNNLYQFLLD